MASDLGSHYIANPYEPSKPFACITLSGVTKLLPTNYLNWKLQVEAFLDGFDLLKYPDGSFPAPTATITTTATPPGNIRKPCFSNMASPGSPHLWCHPHHSFQLGGLLGVPDEDLARPLGASQEHLCQSLPQSP
ncbi:hypothetical protein QL285_061384 [Trifolium repens]|nr:hypothetical protein QL285_061384 [Trifolium repens]